MIINNSHLALAVVKLQRLERSRDTFFEKVSNKDHKTIRGYKLAINNFENFCLEKHGKADMINILHDSDDQDVYDFMQSWINWNSELAPSSIIVLFSRLKKYLYHRGIKLDNQEIKEELEFRSPIQEERYGLTLDNIHTIIDAMQYRHKVQFVCQLSSLMRIGEMTQLKKKHLDLSNLNIIVKIPATIAKFKKGRTTFFSKEASKMLRPMIRKMGDEDLVFGHKADTSVAQTLRRVLVRTGLTMKYESTGDYMINTHSFRAYGITKLSRRDPNFAKKLAGQKGYLIAEYDRLDDNEKLTLYEKFEQDLIIDDSEIKKAKIKELEKEQSEIGKLKTKLEHFVDIESRFNARMTQFENNVELASKGIIERGEIATKNIQALDKKLAKQNCIADSKMTTAQAIVAHDKLVKKYKK